MAPHGIRQAPRKVGKLCDTTSNHQTTLTKYIVTFTEMGLGALMAMTVMSYAPYTIDRDVIARLTTDTLLLRVPLVLFGVPRYLYQVHRGEGGTPTLLILRDRVLQTTAAIYLAVSTVAIYVC